MLVLNVLLIRPERYDKISRIPVHDIADRDYHRLIKNYTGFTRFSLYQPTFPQEEGETPSIPPEAFDDVATLRSEWATKTILPLPWDLSKPIDLANHPKALHLIAYPYDPLNVKMYQVDTHKLETRSIHHDACVVEEFPYALKPPPAILHSEDSPKQLAEQMRAVDLDTLVPVPRRALLYHLYPIGLPWGIHLVNNPAREEEEGGGGGDPDVLMPLGISALRQQWISRDRSRDRKAPSEEAIYPYRRDDNKRLLGRTSDPVPPSLYDETLCDLRYDVHHLNPSSEDFVHFYALRTLMVQTYSSESQRKAVFHEAISDILGVRPQGLDIGNYRTDGAVIVKCGKEPVMYIIIEASGKTYFGIKLRKA